MRNYKGILVKQRGDTKFPFLLLSVPAAEVYQWSAADDIRLDKGNVQRELVQSRWQQVTKFLRSAENVIPTSITIAFSSEIMRVSAAADLAEGEPAYFLSEPDADGFVNLSFPDTVRDQSYIIDGQHRLKGMSEVGEPIYVPVCLFLGLSPLERAFQFIAINNKTHRVPTNNLKALFRNFETIENDLRSRLAQASISSPRFSTEIDFMNEQANSPFYKLIDWPNNRFLDKKMLIQPTAIENSIAAIHRSFPETKADGADSVLVMNAIWNSIFESYGVTIKNVEEFHNLTLKATIQKVTEMICSRLVKIFDPAFSQGRITNDNAIAASDAAKFLVTNLPREFWTDKWKAKGLDTEAGRNLIAKGIRDLKTKVNNLPPEEVQVFDWRKGNPLYESVKEGDEYAERESAD